MCARSLWICDVSGKGKLEEDHHSHIDPSSLTHYDLFIGADMEEIPITKSQAACLAVLAKVRKTGKSVVVTRFGKPVAEVVPPRGSRKRKYWVGSRAGTGQIKGDIVSPVSDESDWGALRG